MPAFFTGDELGGIKAIRYSRTDGAGEWKPQTTTVVEGTAGGRSRAVQRLAVYRSEDAAVLGSLLVAARADGSASVLRVGEGAAPPMVHEWKETRLKNEQRYIGLAVRDRRVYSCTSNGAVRLIEFGEDEAASTSALASIPMRLCDWRLSSDAATFAYGGNEVELSVWNTEAAFAPRAEQETNTGADSRKRKRTDELFSGELWRAKNVPNDNLNLRQPVHITALTYLQQSPSASHHHLVTGTQFGHIRRYDTRVARRPVADWKDVGKVGGVSAVEKGFVEHEVFVSDNGCNISALDLRNGKVSYAYKGLSGAVTALAPAPTLLTSVAQDRFLRLHSTYPPPAQAGQQQENKGEVLDKLYMKVIPTAVVWDQSADVQGTAEPRDDEEDESDEGDEDVWDAMEDADSGNEDARKTRPRSKRSRAAT